jgi:hypothetical protein
MVYDTEDAARGTDTTDERSYERPDGTWDKYVSTCLSTGYTFIHA